MSVMSPKQHIDGPKVALENKHNYIIRQLATVANNQSPNITKHNSEYKKA